MLQIQRLMFVTIVHEADHQLLYILVEFKTDCFNPVTTVPAAYTFFMFLVS